MMLAVTTSAGSHTNQLAAHGKTAITFASSIPDFCKQAEHTAARTQETQSRLPV